MAANYNKNLYRDYEKLTEQYDALYAKKEMLTEENRRLAYYYALEKRRTAKLAEEVAEQKSKLAEQEAQNEALKREIARLSAILDADGTNAGIPTSQTPIRKKKVIPNTREKTGKKRGGQTGHPKAKLKAFADDQVTENIEHTYEVCPDCGGELLEEADICKDELDYEVVVRRIRHHFPKCVCKTCGKHFRVPIPARLKEENQYGPMTQALGLALMNIGNVPMNKVGRIIRGLSEGDVFPTDGYIAKLQVRWGERLKGFRDTLRVKCLTEPLLYWDDTVVAIDRSRACLRFYGTEKLALYYAHAHKDKAGLDEDNILPLLSEHTQVMHDHNIVNYNASYRFGNIECNQHLLRDLQRVTDVLQRQWSQRLKKHIQQAIHDRNEAISAGKEAFSFEYIESFFQTFDDILIEGNREHGEGEYYYSNEEAALLLRLMEYKDNYFAWLCHFELPVTNNLSERGLRGAKTHMKVSGQFLNVDTADYYAALRTYIETCGRNGINEMTALIRLCRDDPYTIDEIFSGAE